MRMTPKSVGLSTSFANRLLRTLWASSAYRYGTLCSKLAVGSLPSARPLLLLAHCMRGHQYSLDQIVLMAKGKFRRVFLYDNIPRLWEAFGGTYLSQKAWI